MVATFQKIKSQREFILAVLIIVMLIAVGLRSPVFVTPSSLDDVLTDTSILIMMALAQMLVIITRGIDLSVASNLAFTGMAISMTNQVFPEVPLILLIMGAIVMGTVLGMFNGLCIAFFKIPPIVTTLGTLSIYRGMTFVISKGQWVSAHEMTRIYQDFPETRFLGFTHIFEFAIIIVLVFWIFLNHTKTGREIYGFGGDELAGLYVGLKNHRINFLVYCISGAVAGFCGYLWTGRFALASTVLATGCERQMIAACVFGGVSVAGGIGTVSGAVLGCLFLG
ncbi:MAG: ABC transporter permease, partial [Proteobacteria bacterium]|nr:ABC transporter permease [Pseudomonadota bacterium]